MKARSRRTRWIRAKQVLLEVDHVFLGGGEAGSHTMVSRVTDVEGNETLDMPARTSNLKAKMASQLALA